MFTYFDIWKMLAGVAFFLLAMNFMENSLRLLAGRGFKIYLKKQTANKAKAIGAGVVVTAILQSSSIVNLLVLSMVGASVVKMDNALAIMLGSNLGTTLNSWILATLGFNYNIESLALPVAGIAGISMAFMKSESKGYLWFKFLFSLAFLFIALGYIKTGIEEFVRQTELSFFAHYPIIVFLLLGILLTTIVQSSSVIIALVLSALHSHAITLYVGTAIVLGSEIGTTVKLFLPAASGQPSKKRVALGNFLFNLVTVIVMYFLLWPVNQFITEVLQIKNNLIALVFFQTLVNICCILIFFPFLKLLGKFLLSRYTGREDEYFNIRKGSVAETDIALEELENGTKHFIGLVMEYSLHSFNQKETLMPELRMAANFHRKSVAGQYEYIKQLHGEMYSFCLQLQKATSVRKEMERVEQLISGIRNAMYAAKNIRDTQHDIEQIRNSSNDTKYNYYVQSCEKLLKFYQRVRMLLENKVGINYFAELTAIHQSITTGYAESVKLLYQESPANRINEIEISTLINFNRELHTSFKSVLFGLKDFLLTAKEAEYFDALPGFIR